MYCEHKTHYFIYPNVSNIGSITKAKERERPVPLFWLYGFIRYIFNSITCLCKLQAYHSEEKFLPSSICFSTQLTHSSLETTVHTSSSSWTKKSKGSSEVAHLKCVRKNWLVVVVLWPESCPKPSDCCLVWSNTCFSRNLELRTTTMKSFFHFINHLVGARLERR